MSSSIKAGTRLGPYEIRSPLGAGGMGEVYLALDTRLNRKVALKILPVALASNQDRMRRFNQEASAAAALNHPHIAHIYEIGKEHEVHFIAMEYIDGETLRDKIHRHKTSLMKLLKYLIQVAEGLTKAHAAGIVHRDLKPDNIMITRDDYAKVLDFGLAKLVEPEKIDTSTASSSEIVTALLPQHSIPGMVLGTVGYMSPEQAQGRIEEIDYRSDIFAFGCILFEAVTGRKAFHGKDALDSLHQIVHAPTPEIRDWNPDAPTELQRIIRRCLAKEPDRRYQSIKDVALELDEVRQELQPHVSQHYSIQPEGTLETKDETEAEGRSRQVPETASIRTSTSSAEYLVNEIKRHKRVALFGFTLLAVFAVGLSFVLYRFIGQKRSTSSGRALKVTRLTSTGKVSVAAISPDGKYVAYSQDEGKQESLWLTQVAASNNVQILPPAETNYRGITFSKDGNFIYVVTVDKENPKGALYQIGVLGGTARKLLVDIISPITTSPDGKQLAFVRCVGCLTVNQVKPVTAVMIVSADGSNERKLAEQSPPDIFSPGGPAWSPDGSVIACGITRRAPGYRQVLALRVTDGVAQPITSKQWGGPGIPNMRLSWLSDNSGILVSGAETVSLSQIWHLAWPGDEARNVTDFLNDYAEISLTSDSETLSAVVSDRVINLWTARDGDITNARKITSGTERADGERGISLTPDGKLAYYSSAGGHQNIWIMDADGGGNRQLSPTAEQNVEPVVSPDGRYIVWASRRSAPWELWRMNIDGNDPKQLNQGGYFQDISPDGRWVVFTPPPGVLFKIPIDGGERIQLTKGRTLRPVISPDGEYIACNYQEKPEDPTRVAIIPFAGGPPKKLLDISSFNGVIRWTPDGRAIAYIVTENQVSNIWTQPLDGRPPKQLTDFKSERIFNFVWSRDGQKIALSRGVVNKDVVLISGFK
jgi:serine/threonine protein kinase